MLFEPNQRLLVTRLTCALLCCELKVAGVTYRGDQRALTRQADPEVSLRAAAFLDFVRLLAKRRGATLVIINREATDFDEIADLVVRADIGTVLEPFATTQSAA